jgi:hypothetical protein
MVLQMPLWLKQFFSVVLRIPVSFLLLIGRIPKGGVATARLISHTFESKRHFQIGEKHWPAS